MAHILPQSLCMHEPTIPSKAAHAPLLQRASASVCSRSAALEPSARDLAAIAVIIACAPPPVGAVCGLPIHPRGCSLPRQIWLRASFGLRVKRSTAAIHGVPPASDLLCHLPQLAPQMALPQCGEALCVHRRLQHPGNSIFIAVCSTPHVEEFTTEIDRCLLYLEKQV